MRSHCSMVSFPGSRLRSAFGIFSVLLGAACGPIGGVEADDSSAGASASGATGGVAGTGSGGAASEAVLPDPPAFKTVGYWPSWTSTPSTILQFDKLNYINYAFGIEAADGSVTMPQPTGVLGALVSRAHQAGVRVLISIGGWNNGDDSAFRTLSGNADARAKFASTLAAAVDLYHLDGVDIDWEYPRGNDVANYTALMQTLSNTFKPKGKLVTIAAAPETYGSEGITADAMPYIDLVNIMAYDGGGSDPSGHSPYSLAQSALMIWQQKGFPNNKLILGVPFYSRPSNTAYSALIQGDPAAAQEDSVNGQYYNGIPTVQAKTALAMTQGGGIMAWDLSQDARITTGSPDLSLVSAIYSKIHASP